MPWALSGEGAFQGAASNHSAESQDEQSGYSPGHHSRVDGSPQRSATERRAGFQLCCGGDAALRTSAYPSLASRGDQGLADGPESEIGSERSSVSKSMSRKPDPLTSGWI